MVRPLAHTQSSYAASHSYSPQTLELAPWQPLSGNPGAADGSGGDPDPEDMWRSWNLGKKPVTGDVVADPSWWDRYGVEMCTPNMTLAEIAAKGSDGLWRLH